MNVLVACEFSGTVRDAFRKAGHSAWSCDILPTESKPQYHITGDALEAIRRGRPTDGAKWDLLVAHPPCTYLNSAGLHWTTRGLRDPKLTEDALAFVRALLAAPVPSIALENPVGCISTRIRKPSQTVQPWMFGADASKGTCLWLKGLPLLTPTRIMPPKGWQVVKFAMDMVEDEGDEAWCEEHQMNFADCSCIGPTQDGIVYQTRNGVLFGRPEDSPHTKMIWANQTPSGQNKLGPSPERAAERARTYPGLAAAMADQWGNPANLR